MKSLIAELIEHPFFEGLPDDFFETLAACAIQVKFAANQMIYHEGDPADQFLLILKGKVAIEIFASQRGSLIVQTVTAGEVLGWSWLFAPYRRRFDARTLEATEAIGMNAVCLREKAEQDYRLGYELFKRFSKVVVARLQATRLQLIDFYGRSSTRRPGSTP
jgi:CRP/FNR family transcriptional regulator, cyclic AMP receptor protein